MKQKIENLLLAVCGLFPILAGELSSYFSSQESYFFRTGGIQWLGIASLIFWFIISMLGVFLNMSRWRIIFYLNLISFFTAVLLFTPLLSAENRIGYLLQNFHFPIISLLAVLYDSLHLPIFLFHGIFIQSSLLLLLISFLGTLMGNFLKRRKF